MDVPVAENRPDGLAWAFTMLPGAPPARGEPRPSGGPGWDWLHYDLVHSQARATIEAMQDLPRFARHILIGTDETLRLECDGDAVAGVLPGFLRSGGSDEHEIVWWRFAMRPDRLVTGRRRPVRTLAEMWNAMQSGHGTESPAALIALAIAGFAREARHRVGLLDEHLDATEETLLDQSASVDLGGLGARFGHVRRELAAIKRALTPLARLLGDDLKDLPDWAVNDGHDAAHDAVAGALDDIAALHDRARALHDELAARLAEETNRRLYIVSVVTTVVMPATLVVGFFGMNTGGMLWAEHGLGTVFALVVCIVSMLATLGLLRWRRLL